MIPLAWNWIRKNFNLVLLLAATACLALALGELIRGTTWSLLMPVSLSAVLAGWGVGKSRLNPKQAWVRLTALGIPGVIGYVAGLLRPLARLGLSVLALIPQVILWISVRIPVDAGLLLSAWAELTAHLASLLIRLWEWAAALLAGSPFVDPLAAGLVWNVLLWLVGAWAGWQLRRYHQALPALAPGAALLVLVLDYAHGELGLLVVYLAITLALMGLARVEALHLQWEQRRLDYSESVRIDTLVMVGIVTIALTLSAAGTPSISWRELLDRLRGRDRAAQDWVAESLGLEPLANVAGDEAYRSGGLPRSHLLNMPAELLQDVVLTVSTGELPSIPESVADIHPPLYRWRALTYDVYSGAGWSSSPAQDLPLASDLPLLEPPQGYRPLTQHIKRLPGQSRYVYWAGLLAQVDADIQIAWRTQPPAEPDPAHNGDMLGALTDPDEYTLVAYLPQFSAQQLRATGSDYPQQIASRYLRLPEDTPERVLALARELTQAAPTPYDRAAALESYLRSFPYTLEVAPPPPGHDVVDYFLFSAQQGYCDYYATSMVVLARAVGLPARMVIGYTSGDYNAPTAEYIVRQADAHSWAEVYFSGIGWVEFEPTASLPAIDRGEDGSAAGLPQGLPGSLSVLSWLKTQWHVLISSLGGQVILVGLGLLLFFSLWQLGAMACLYVLPAHRAVAHMYAHLQRASARLLPGLPAGHTPQQFGTALAFRLKSTNNRLLGRVFSSVDSEIERLVALYETQVFSAYPPTKPQVRAGIQAWTRLRWRLWVAKGWARYLADQAWNKPDAVA